MRLKGVLILPGYLREASGLRRPKGHHNLDYIPVSTMAFLMDPQSTLDFQGQLSNLQKEPGLWGMSAGVGITLL